MTNDTINEAINILNKMAIIVRNDMLTRGQYVSTTIDLELRDKGAICGGHKACAVGSLYLAGGIKPHEVYPGKSYNYFVLQGVDRHERAEFLAERPALRAAYDALNEAAKRFIDRHNLDLFDGERFEIGGLTQTNGWMELLFEAADIDGHVLDAQVELPKIINNAKRALRRSISK
jgi:hypothetical protein